MQSFLWLREINPDNCAATMHAIYNQNAYHNV